MVTDVEHTYAQDFPSTDRVYSPDILPKLRSLLADLADIDLVYRMDVETIRRSPIDEDVKRDMIKRLQQDHQKRRTLVIRELSALESKIQAACGRP